MFLDQHIPLILEQHSCQKIPKILSINVDNTDTPNPDFKPKLDINCKLVP